MFETQNILLESNLRSMVKLQTDGGLKTGLDVIKLLYSALIRLVWNCSMIAMGCKYLRICHLNNCATGVATQHVKIIDEQFNGGKKVQSCLFIAEGFATILQSLVIKVLIK